MKLIIHFLDNFTPEGLARDADNQLHLSLDELTAVIQRADDYAPDDIKTIKALLTMIDGKIEFRSEDLP